MKHATERLHSSIFWRCAALAAAIALSSTARAYNDDTHYVVTYYIARRAGYTPQQAYRIASANVGVDYDPKTEPVGSVRAAATASTGIQNQRVLFHAMLDEVRFPTALNSGLGRPHLREATAAIRSRDAEFLTAARALGNIGPYLHFLQDRYAHAGYGSAWGHWDLASFAPDAKSSSHHLPFGSKTDYLGFEPDAAQRRFLAGLGFTWPAPRQTAMVEATVQALESFLAAGSPRQSKASSHHGAAIVRTVEALSRVPASANNKAAAMRELNQILAGEGELSLLPPDPLPYTFTTNAAGDITGVENPDDFVLWGSLTLDDQARQVSSVRVLHLPDRLGDKSYELGVLRPGQVLTELPIGSVLLQMELRNGGQYSETFDVTGRENRYVVDLPRSVVLLSGGTADEQRDGATGMRGAASHPTSTATHAPPSTTWTLSVLVTGVPVDYIAWWNAYLRSAVQMNRVSTRTNGAAGGPAVFGSGSGRGVPPILQGPSQTAAMEPSVSVGGTPFRVTNVTGSGAATMIEATAALPRDADLRGETLVQIAGRTINCGWPLTGDGATADTGWPADAGWSGSAGTVDEPVWRRRSGRSPDADPTPRDRIYRRDTPPVRDAPPPRDRVGR